MSRAIVSAPLAIAAVVGAVLAFRSDGRGDGPPRQAAEPAKVAAKSPAGKSVAPAAATPIASANARPAVATAVQRALAEPADFSFADTPLSDIADSIAGRYKINVLVDSKALADAGVTPNTPFTERVKGVSLRSALELLLSSKDLAYFQADDNVIRITTADVAKTRTTTQLYDVRDFADPPIEFCAGPTAWTQLSQIVTTTVAPQSWDSNGGAGSLTFFDGKMLVSQTYEIQEQITDLLSQLQLARKLNAAANDGRDLPSPIGGESRIEQVLDSRQDFLFVGVPLGDAAQKLSKQLGIPIQLDTKSLQGAGVTAATPLSLKARQIRVRIGLRELLDPKDLDYVVDRDMLLITSGDVEKTKTVTQLYPVKDLVGDGDPRSADATYDSVAAAITAAGAPSSWDANGGAGSIAAFPICKLLVVSQTEPLQQEVKNVLAMLRAAPKSKGTPTPASGAPQVRIYPLTNVVRSTTEEGQRNEDEQIVEMIRKLIEPKSWGQPNAYIGLAAGSIVVRQTPAVHRHIQNLLDALGAAPPAKGGAAARPTATLPASPAHLGPF